MRFESIAKVEAKRYGKSREAAAVSYPPVSASPPTEMRKHHRPPITTTVGSLPTPDHTAAPNRTFS
jgi:hypothetical protein